MKQTNDALRARVDEFVADLAELIRDSALEAVREALGDDSGGGAGRASTARGGKRRTTKKRATKKRTSKKRTTKRRAKAASRPDPKLAGKVLDALKAEPNQGVEQLSKVLGVASQKLKGTVAQLLDDGKVRRKGKARGTKYSVK